MKNKKYLTIGASFTICLLCLLLFIYSFEAEKWEEKRNRTKFVASAEVSKLQYVLDTLLLKTQTLEMLVVENEGKIVNFDQIAENLCDNPAIRSLQLAPDGVVTQVYPIKGNENAFVDLFNTPERATEAIAARDSGKMTLSGPFDLYQGGFGMIGRRPVYLAGQDGQKEFWGFTIIVLDLPEAFAPARLDIFVKEDFEYKIYRTNPDTGKTQIIDQSSKGKFRDPVEISFEVPNSTWTFSVMPKGGWIDKEDVAIELSIAFIMALLVAFIAAFIIKLRSQKENMYQLAMTDSLTGLHNYSRLMSDLERYSCEKKPFVLFFMDLDGFKKVNDTYGHSAGNQVLVQSAERMRRCIKEKGDVFRNGGDEFCAVVTGHYEEEDCIRLARSISQNIAQPFLVDGHEIQCQVSIGYARYPGDADNIEKLLRLADDRMYKMKKEGTGYF